MNYGYPQPYQYQPQSYGTYGQYQPPQAQQLQRQPVMQQPVTGFSCRPVADEAEARAIPTDFNGTTMVLVDQAHGCVYTKALNPMDGSPVFFDVPATAAHRAGTCGVRHHRYGGQGASGAAGPKKTAGDQ